MMWHLLPLLAGCVETHLGDPDADATDPVVVEERFTQAPYPSLDVLFVMDSTGSMAAEQAGFAAAAGDFVGVLDGLGIDYQLGVVTMDPVEVGVLRGRPWILTPVDEDPVAGLMAALQPGTDSPPPSGGLDAAALALDPDNEANIGFRRIDAALHVVFVSDGDDASGVVLGADPVTAFTTLLAAEAVRTTHPARASAVVDDGSGACTGAPWDATPGTRYVAVATASGGAVASICTEDFSPVVASLSDVGVEGTRVFPLQADPVDGSVTVSVDGARQADGWAIDHAGPTLVFVTEPPLDAEIRVRYEIAS